MQLQLDTENKMIKIESSINLKELYKFLKHFFPNKEWEEYTLLYNTQSISSQWTDNLIITYCGDIETTTDKYYISTTDL